VFVSHSFFFSSFPRIFVSVLICVPSLSLSVIITQVKECVCVCVCVWVRDETMSVTQHVPLAPLFMSGKKKNAITV